MMLNFSEQLLHFRVSCDGLDTSFLVTAVYAKSTRSERQALWGELNTLAQQIYLPWIVGGDFNSILDLSE